MRIRPSHVHRLFIEGRPQEITDRQYQLGDRAQALLALIPPSHPKRDQMEYFLLAAQQRRADVDSGSHSDNGAGMIEDQVDLWVSVAFGYEEPTCWKELLRAYRRDTDSEYANYLALKEKYE